MGSKYLKQRGRIVAPHDSVILKQLDTNDYNQEDIEYKPGSVIKDQKEITHGYEYKGIVVAVGNKVQTDIEVGDVVHHGLHSTTVVAFNGENYAKLPEYQILLVEKFDEQSTEENEI